MSDIAGVISPEAEAAIDQIIVDSGRLHVVVNGTGTQNAITEDGSLIPSVRKALIDNLYFKTPILNWAQGTSVSVFNQLYKFTGSDNVTSWWYAPAATTSSPVVMGSSPLNDVRFKPFLDPNSMANTYAPINSPNFTGNARAPTASPTDDSTTIANTAWVQDHIQDLRDDFSGALTGSFDNVTVTNTTTTKDLVVSGTSTFGGTIDATNELMRLNKLQMVGADAEISFEESGTPPTGITQKSNITPYRMTTGGFDAEDVSVDHLSGGEPIGTNPSFELTGLTNADYVHITGNSSNDPTRPQLIVDGIVEIGTLRVANFDGIDVNGLDIHPNSVTTDTYVDVGTNLTVGADMTVSGNANLANTTTVQDLVITGSVSGISIGVDGQDIAPNSVTVAQGLSVGATTTLNNLVVTGTVVGIDMSVDGDDILPNSVTTTQGLTVGGDAKVEGNTEVQDLTVIGTLTANINLSGQDITVANLNVTGTATMNQAQAQNIQTNNLWLTAQEILGEDTTAAWIPPIEDGTVMNVVVDKDMVITNIEDLPEYALSGVIYLRMDAVGGHTVTFDTNYVILNSGIDINTAADSVTLIQFTYSGYENDPVDVIIAPRP